MSSVAIDAFRLVAEPPTTSDTIYISELAESLAALPEVHEVILLIPRRPERAFIYKELLNHEKVEFVYPANANYPEKHFRSQVAWIQRRIPYLIRSLNRSVDYFVAPYHLPPVLLPKQTEIFTVIHDLCGLGATYPKTKLGFYQHLSRFLIASIGSDWLIPVSEFTRAQLIRRFPAIEPRVTRVVYPKKSRDITSNIDHTLVEQVLQQYGLRYRSYFLAFGNPHPRKGLDLVLSSYRLFKRRAGSASLLLLVVKRYRTVVQRMVREQGLENVIMVSDIPSLERDALYKAASALLFPSRCEGFGSPIMEAMSQGCPPIAWRDAGPTKELVASAVPLLDKLDPEEIVVRMIEYATLPCSARAELADRLVERSKVFVGEDFGREFYEAMVETSKAEGEIIR